MIKTNPHGSATPVLQRSPRDWWAVGLILVVSTVLLAGAFFTADIRAASLEATNPPGERALAEKFVAIPDNVTEDARFPAPAGGNTRPVVVAGLVLSTEGHALTARYPDGEPAWRYTRENAELCSLGAAWGKAVATYRPDSDLGCGDVVALDVKTGRYAGTRSDINSPEVAPISSNDRVGTVAPDRTELWRSDMVRTAEYGETAAVQEPDVQPHEDCDITSALTRTSLFAVTEKCPAGADNPAGSDDEEAQHSSEGEPTEWLRFMDTTPEDSREPEVKGNYRMPAGSRLVSIGQGAAAIYTPPAAPVGDSKEGESNTAAIIAVNEEGVEIGRRPVPAAPRLADVPVYTPATADLPHHMSWFDGERLHLFTPSDQQLSHTIEGAIGTGATVDGRLLVPTADGYAVVNEETGITERTIPVDRGGYSGPVSVAVAGDHLVEKRGEEIVTLRAQWPARGR